MTTSTSHTISAHASTAEQLQPVEPSKAPTHAAYHVRDSKFGKAGAKAFWTRIGSAWAHADGGGYSVQLDCVPVDGRLSLRVIAEKNA